MKKVKPTLSSSLRPAAQASSGAGGGQHSRARDATTRDAADAAVLKLNASLARRLQDSGQLAGGQPDTVMSVTRPHFTALAAALKDAATGAHPSVAKLLLRIRTAMQASVCRSSSKAGSFSTGGAAAAAAAAACAAAAGRMGGALPAAVAFGGGEASGMPPAEGHQREHQEQVGAPDAVAAKTAGCAPTPQRAGSMGSTGTGAATKQPQQEVSPYLQSQASMALRRTSSREPARLKQSASLSRCRTGSMARQTSAQPKAPPPAGGRSGDCLTAVSGAEDGAGCSIGAAATMAKAASLQLRTDSTVTSSGNMRRGNSVGSGVSQQAEAAAVQAAAAVAGVAAGPAAPAATAAHAGGHAAPHLTILPTIATFLSDESDAEQAAEASCSAGAEPQEEPLITLARAREPPGPPDRCELLNRTPTQLLKGGNEDVTWLDEGQLSARSSAPQRPSMVPRLSLKLGPQ